MATVASLSIKCTHIMGLAIEAELAIHASPTVDSRTLAAAAERPVTRMRQILLMMVSVTTEA
jgi:hypothetical protein